MNANGNSINLISKIAIVLILSISSISSIKSQDVNFGIGPTIAFDGPVFGAQAKLAYGFTERFRPQFTYSYYIKENVNYSMDFDAKYRLFSVEEYHFYPLGGINLSRIDGDSRISLNLGLFLEIDREWVNLYVEPKMVVDDFSYFVLSGGLFF